MLSTEHLVGVNRLSTDTSRDESESDNSSSGTTCSSDASSSG